MPAHFVGAVENILQWGITHPLQGKFNLQFSILGQLSDTILKHELDRRNWKSAYLPPDMQGYHVPCIFAVGAEEPNPKPKRGKKRRGHQNRLNRQEWEYLEYSVLTVQENSEESLGNMQPEVKIGGDHSLSLEQQIRSILNVCKKYQSRCQSALTCPQNFHMSSNFFDFFFSQLIHPNLPLCWLFLCYLYIYHLSAIIYSSYRAGQPEKLFGIRAWELVERVTGYEP
jgi:hypothetical protein